MRPLPGGLTLAKWKEKLRNGEVRVQLRFPNQDITLDEEDIDVNAGITITSILNGDTDLQPGRAVMKQLTANILPSEKTMALRWTDQCLFRIGVKVNGQQYGWMTLYRFIGDRPLNVRTTDTIEFTAYDDMQRFDVIADDFLSTVTYPITVQNFILAMCTYVGIAPSFPAGQPGMEILGKTLTEQPFEGTGYTCRDIISWIAEACGLYAVTYGQGSLRFVWFSDQTSSYSVEEDDIFAINYSDPYPMTWDDFDQYTWDEAEDFTWDELENYYDYHYAVKSVKVKQSNGVEVDYPAETDRNVLMIIDNPFLVISDVVQDPPVYVKPIYDRLAAFGGRIPMNVECVGDPLVDTGDIISVPVKDGFIAMPIYSRTLRYNGYFRDTYEITGTKDRQAVTNENKQKIINNRLIKLTVQDEYYHRQSGIEIIPEGVTISGSQYVKVSADSDNDWIFNELGLSLHNNTRDKNVVQFSGGFNAQALFTESGVYAYNPLGDTTHGRLAFVATDITANEYTFFFYQYDHTNGACLAPRVGQECDLGENTAPFRNLYATNFVVKGRLTGGQTTDANNSRVSIWISPDSDTSKQRYIFMMDDQQNDRYLIYANSNKYIYFYGSIATPSSRAMKRNITLIDETGKIIDNLRPVWFTYNNDPTGKRHLGLIWEEAEEVVPEICDETEAGKTINYTELVPVLLKEIQELRKRVAELEQKVGD